METVQDDNSKVILVFMMVSILFFPMSIFGLGLKGISETDSGVRQSLRPLHCY